MDPNRFASDPRWPSSLRSPLDLQPAVRPEDADDDDRGVAKLLEAIHFGNGSRAKKEAKDLIKEGISVDEAVAAASVAVTGAKRRGPLHIAAANGNAEICRFLINTCKVGVDVTDSDGATPLIYAIQGLGSIQIAKILLRNGADPNKADNRGVAPLHIAAEKGLLEVANLLLSNGAWVHLICENHGAPLQIAAQNEHAKMVDLLLEHNSNVPTSQVDDMGMDEFVQGRCKGSFAKLFHLFRGNDVVGSKMRGLKILCQAFRYVIDMIRHSDKSWGGKFAACHLRLTAGKFRIDLAPLLPATAENTWADLNGIATCMVSYFVLGSKRCIYVRRLFDLCEKLHKGLARGMNELGARDRYLNFIYDHPCFGFSIERGDLIKGIGMALKYSSTTDINAMVSCMCIASGPPRGKGKDWRDDVINVAVLHDVLFANIKDAKQNKDSTYFRPVPRDNFIFCRHALEHGPENTLIKTGGNSYQAFCPSCKQVLRNKHQENLVSKSASVPGSSLQYAAKRIQTETSASDTSSSDTRVQTQPLQHPEELDLSVGEVFDGFISDSICEIRLEAMLDNSPFVQVRLKVFARSIRPELNAQDLNAEGEEEDEDEGQNGVLSSGLQGPSSAQDNGGS